MVRDYLAHGLNRSPLSFATEYYEHYPFFAIGYWPPLYYILMGLWFLAVGVGRLQALLLVAVVASGCACMICILVRRRAGQFAGFCAGLLFLTLPEVQTWFCAVMVDQTVVLFSLAAVWFAIRYFERPSWRSAIGFAILAAAAVLTKYSGLYICAIPIVAVVVLHRFELVRARSFWMQHVIICCLVAPWLLWTAHLAWVGLPEQRRGPVVGRVLSFSRESLLSFPPATLVFVLMGVMILMARKQAWRADTKIIALSVAANIGFLAASPVDSERRYLQSVAAALLVLSLIGWWTLIETAGRRGRVWARAALAAVALTVFAMSSLQVLRFRRAPDAHARLAVRYITGQPGWVGKRILVAPDMEGPTIAEFAMRDLHRPGYWLERPGKRFARLDWFGHHYEAKFPSAEALMADLRANPVDLVIWHNAPAALQRPDERQMREALTRWPSCWQPVITMDTWQIYQYNPGR
jgi:4-amino-4-deoxy-L-arabinose transferase-like glycosyltransferase